MSMALPANPALPTLWIIGDSTVRNGQGDGANGQWGWGDEIAPFFNTQKINVVNRALGGTSSRTYYDFHWPTVLDRIHKGDYVLMQFGHNDNGSLDDPARARGTLPGNGEETSTIDNPITRHQETVHTYGWYLRQIVAEARTHGATPVVLSLIPRKNWTATASIARTTSPGPARQRRKPTPSTSISTRSWLASMSRWDPPPSSRSSPTHTLHTSLAAPNSTQSPSSKHSKACTTTLKKYLSPAAKPLPPFRDKSKK